MSRGRPTLPEFRAREPGPFRERRVASREERATDTEPSSGIALKREMLAKVPRLAVSTADLMAMPLDHRAGFIASFVDGTFTIEMILDACAMRPEEALSVLGDLVARGVIVVA
jgi:hypothetical protein